MGPEPLAPSFTAARLGSILAGRRASIKSVLLDQRRVAGVGNIYADEALWRARIHPRRPAGALGPAEVARLHRAVRVVLRRGIELQGSTLRDYATPDGDQGGMQNEFHVYGRLGEPCDRCGRPIDRIVVGGPRNMALPTLPGGVSLPARATMRRCATPTAWHMWSVRHRFGALSRPTRLPCDVRLEAVGRRPVARGWRLRTCLVSPTVPSRKRRAHASRGTR